MALTTRFTELFSVRHPVCLAAMDIVADAALTCAVTRAGGLGLLGAGYGDDAWLDRELARLRTALGPQPGAFGVGFITWSLAKRPHLLARALASKPNAIWLSFGDPQPFVAQIHAAGAKLICQVQTVAMARDALEKGADVIVAQGGEAGGHGVSRGTLALVPAVVDAVGARVPVLAAGGIADGRGLAAALMLGADGVVLGTRFYATTEAYGHPKAKQVLCAASGDDTVRSVVFDISRRNVWPAPFNGRCVANAHAKRWLGREADLLRQVDIEAPRYQAARDAGDFDTAAVIAGEALDLIHDIESANDVMERIVQDAEARLARAPSWIAASEHSPTA